MLAALLLASCLSMPLFGELDGPPCGDETEECRCTECFGWEPSERATYYMVTRLTPSTGSAVLVGTLTEQLGVDEETGEPWRIPPATVWCPARDNPFPREGTLYEYTVHACNAAGCVPSTNSVRYRAAPYACYEGGREVACYVGDPVEAP
jgi:hypothetical protein